jgi:hypothetical protein
VADKRRENHGRLDHPGDRIPKIAEKLEKRIDLLFGDLIVSVMREPELRLGLGQAGRR